MKDVGIYDVVDGAPIRKPSTSWRALFLRTCEYTALLYLMIMSKRKSSILDKDISHNRISKRGKGDLGNSTRKLGDKFVTDANRLQISEFASRYIDQTQLNFTPAQIVGQENGEASLQYTIDLASPEDAGSAILSEAFDLIEATQQGYYLNSSIGWHPRRKKAEMREEAMRYLLVRQAAQHNSSRRLLGYLSFMLTFDSLPSMPVLYIYEVHIDGNDTGKGLGSHLMRIAENIAHEVGLEKVMLTCFLRNEKAKAFYEKRGYLKDVCSPEDRAVRGKTVKVDYWIMSKPVTPTGGLSTSRTTISQNDAGTG
nr:n-alpha-acetyltransferase 40 [Quercus suber]